MLWYRRSTSTPRRLSLSPTTPALSRLEGAMSPCSRIFYWSSQRLGGFAPFFIRHGSIQNIRVFIRTARLLPFVYTWPSTFATRTNSKSRAFIRALLTASAP
ncbi:hypothetical protein EXIGLDRAFT_312655 [Exidia glandulosa HHB12029]|uniref:Uncharacterized protein n=1 Tax=Exidia glandulosa HHB12029 TaxID=1314781 RepID=A0A165CYX7_EXIGL|nr:hypothetical protein EXIGLDRAFT_312655 [Exidia glandulosa HHB12029]